MAEQKTAPCGHSWRDECIVRFELSGVLWPTCFVRCRCTVCLESWVERYEFDFAVPVVEEQDA